MTVQHIHSLASIPRYIHDSVCTSIWWSSCQNGSSSHQKLSI